MVHDLSRRPGILSYPLCEYGRLSHRMVAGFRYVLKDGKPGVAVASFPFHGESEADAAIAANGRPNSASAPPTASSIGPVSIEKDLARSRFDRDPRRNRRRGHRGGRAGEADELGRRR